MLSLCFLKHITFIKNILIQAGKAKDVRSDQTLERKRCISPTSVLNDKEKLSRLTNTPAETLRQQLTGLTRCRQSQRTQKNLAAFYPVASNHLMLCLTSVAPCQVLLVVDLMVVETEGRRDGKQRETPPPTNLQLLRNLAPAASATRQDTPESPVLSGDGPLKTLFGVMEDYDLKVWSQILFF